MSAHIHTAHAGQLSQVGRFALHFVQMCAAMCIGLGIGDGLYFLGADAAGYGEPFKELPELSLLVVTVSMTAPMAAWMRFRGMSSRHVFEMSASMVILALALLAGAALGLLARADMPLAEHGLMMPAMLIPMVLRWNDYSHRGRGSEIPGLRRVGHA